MPRAKKLPSGSWRCRVYAYTDPNGIKHYESFTAPTKHQAEMLAASFANSKARQLNSDLTVGEAIEGYIQAKEAVLSPATIRGYRSLQRSRYRDIERIKIKKIDSHLLQTYVSTISADISAKTVKNAYGLLVSAIKHFQPESTFHVTLPKIIKKRPASPSDADVQLLFAAAPAKLKVCIALAAFGSMRRSEICALKYGDFEGNIAHIQRAIVRNSSQQWVEKQMPKTSDSVRDVYLPDKVMELIGSGDADARIVSYKTPSSITNRFVELRDRLGLPIRFHDLRHYYASIGAILGIPDNYLADFGGWRPGSSVMKEVYQNNIQSYSRQYFRRMADHFDDLL